MTYRAIQVERTLPKRGPVMDTHIWSSGWDKSKYDSTMIALLQLKDHMFHVHQVYNIRFKNTLSNWKNRLADARIFNAQGDYYLSGNIFIYKGDDEDVPDIIQSVSQNPNVIKCMQKHGHCAIMVIMRLSIKMSQPNRLNPFPIIFQVEEVLVPCIHRYDMVNKLRNMNSIEKNWVFFTHNRQIWFEYLLHHHIVISLECGNMYTTNSPFETLLKTLPKGTFFSPGCPLVPFSSANQLIGVGHVKWSYQSATVMPDVNQTDYLHPVDLGGYVYAMFFYIVENKPPFNITHYSNPFIPKYS